MCIPPTTPPPSPAVPSRFQRELSSVGFTGRQIYLLRGRETFRGINAASRADSLASIQIDRES